MWGSSLGSVVARESATQRIPVASFAQCLSLIGNMLTSTCSRFAHVALLISQPPSQSTFVFAHFAGKPWRLVHSPASPRMQLHANGTRRAPWHCKLGRCRALAFRVTGDSLQERGGQAPILDVQASEAHQSAVADIVEKAVGAVSDLRPPDTFMLWRRLLRTCGEAPRNKFIL